MYMIESNAEQQAALPLPSAALIIDTRGMTVDKAIELLQIEVEDLTNEMKAQDVNHWRHLTDILSFEIINPLGDDEVKRLRFPQQAAEIYASKVEAPDGLEDDPGPAATDMAPGLTGQINISREKGVLTYLPAEEQEDSASSDASTDLQDLEMFVNEIDRIRNNRIAAISDLRPTGTGGHNSKDATVRVIFLTDATLAASLHTAAAYAAQLKMYYRQLERSGHQFMLSTTVLCLNNSGKAGSPKELVEGLRWNDSWEHLDSLIISEAYREDAARIPGSMQAYLAELLLYVLLITPPLPIGAPPPNNQKHISSPSTAHGEYVYLPANTYVIGLAAMEYSARWGRRLLNYGLVEQVVQTLQDKPSGDERQRIQNAVDEWLSEWRMQVANAIPDQMPSEITELRAISNATEVTAESFTSNRFSPRIGKSTIDDLNRYKMKLAQTYTMSSEEREASYRDAQARSRQQNVVLDPTLQSALDNIPMVQQHIREMQLEDEAYKQASPLAKALTQAQRILCHRKFFTGARGAIPRARLQLATLGDSITAEQRRHQQNIINLTVKREKFEAEAASKIDELEKHTNSWPFFAAFLSLKRPMAVTALLFILFISIVAIATGFAWLSHLLKLIAPDTILPTLQSPLLFGLSTFTFIMAAVILVAILVELAFFGRSLLNNQYSAMKVEALFWLLLLVSAITVLVLNLSRGGLDNDSFSTSFLFWLAPIYWWSSIAFAITAVVLIIEIAYSLWWFGHLKAERDRIVNFLQAFYKSDVDEVSRYIANSIGLELLERAGLVERQERYGSYYTRIAQLSDLLDKVLAEAKKQQTHAANRIVSKQSEQQQGTDATSKGSWLNLRIRDELLDVKVLTAGYRRLKDNLTQETVVLKELAQVLLRILGEEEPGDIEQHFYEQSMGREEEYAKRIFLATIVAEALRASTTNSLEDRISTLNERSKQLEYSASQYAAIRTLLEKLEKKASDETLEPLSDVEDIIDKAEPGAVLATRAVAIWGQMLWEHKDKQLDQVLTSSGVLPKLLEEGYKEQYLKRLFSIRTSLSGRSLGAKQISDLYLLLPRSPYSQKFNLNLQGRQIIAFPDNERLVLLQIQRYTAKPHLIQGQLSARANGHTNLGATPPEQQNGSQQIVRSKGTNMAE